MYAFSNLVPLQGAAALLTWKFGCVCLGLWVLALLQGAAAVCF